MAPANPRPRRWPAVLAAVLVFGATAATGGQAANLALRQYNETIALQADGTALVRISVLCGEGCPRELRLPYHYKKPGDLKATQGEARGATGELAAQIVEDNGVSFLQLRNIDAASLDRSLVATFTIANYLDWKKASKEGLFFWAHEFSNTTNLAIDKYAVEFVIPDGFVVQAIERSRPALTSKDSKSPYALFNDDRHEHVVLRADKGLKAGREAMLEISFRSNRKSPMLLGFMLLLAGGYLVFFRDLLTQARSLRAEERAG